MENLAKGILRAKYDLQVNKDGTIRFDATELPLVSFKLKEIGVSVGKIKELGYFTILSYHNLTGACLYGILDFCKRENIKLKQDYSNSKWEEIEKDTELDRISIEDLKTKLKPKDLGYDLFIKVFK